MSIEVLAYQTQRPHSLGLNGKMAPVSEASSGPRSVRVAAGAAAAERAEGDAQATGPPYRDIPAVAYAHEQRMLKSEVREAPMSRPRRSGGSHGRVGGQRP
jgi:hypothetical protein